jgi:hypothetical protein
VALLTRIPLSGVSRHYCKRSLLPLLALSGHPLRQCCEPSRAINYFLAQRFESERKMILNAKAGHASAARDFWVLLDLSAGLVNRCASRHALRATSSRDNSVSCNAIRQPLAAVVGNTTSSGAGLIQYDSLCRASRKCVRRRDKTGGKTRKVERHKTLSCRDAPKTVRHRSSVAAEETRVAQLTPRRRANSESRELAFDKYR